VAGLNRDDPIERKVDDWARQARKTRQEFTRSSTPEAKLDPRVYDRNNQVYDPTERKEGPEFEKPELNYSPPGPRKGKVKSWSNSETDKAKREAEAKARAAEPKTQTFARAARGQEADGAHSRTQGDDGGRTHDGGDDGGRAP
jgi:hypothetical protein